MYTPLLLYHIFSSKVDFLNLVLLEETWTYSSPTAAVSRCCRSMCISLVESKFFSLSPLFSVGFILICCSLCHSHPPSLPLDFSHHLSKWGSGVTPMWWVCTACQDGLLPWEIGEKPAHTSTYTSTSTYRRTADIHRYTRPCIHPYSHIIAHVHGRTITVTHTHGPVDFCQAKVTQSDRGPVGTDPGRQCCFTASTGTWNMLKNIKTNTHSHTLLPSPHVECRSYDVLWCLWVRKWCPRPLFGKR